MWGSGFRVSGLGFGVLLVLRVLHFVERVVGIRVLDLNFRVQGWGLVLGV